MAALHLTSNNFEHEVIKSKKPVLIDFWASWCGPCRSLSPIIEELSEELSESVKVGKINIDEEPELASRFSIMSIPTVVAVHEGAVKAKSVGLKSKTELKQALDF